MRSQSDLIAIDPANPSVAYLGNQNGQVFKTSNGGASWTGTSLGSAPLTVNAIAVRSDRDRSGESLRRVPGQPERAGFQDEQRRRVVDGHLSRIRAVDSQCDRSPI